MKILLSNDDSIYATGIRVIHDLLVDLGHEVNVVAPEFPQSGMSHAITLNATLITKKVFLDGKLFGTAVNGYPADCVRLGLHELYPDTELVVTGINHGLNAGPAIYYSGTVSGAFEGYLTGRRAIALSLNSMSEAKMEKVKEKFAPYLGDIIENCDNQLLYNVNIPHDEIIGVKVTRQSRSIFRDCYDKRYDPQNRTYYWLRGRGFTEEMFPHDDQYEDHDVAALQSGYITISPLQFDLTNYVELPKLMKKFSTSAKSKPAKAKAKTAKKEQSINKPKKSRKAAAK